MDPMLAGPSAMTVRRKLPRLLNACDSGRIKLGILILPCLYVHADPPRSERCRSHALQIPDAMRTWRVATMAEGPRRAGSQSLISLPHILRIRASLRSTVLVTQPRRTAISSSVYPSSFQVATLCKVESPSCSINR